MKRFGPLFRILLNLLGPAILVYFLATTDLQALWATLRQTNPWWFGLSCVLVVPFMLLKGWRWALILRAWHMPLPLLEASALYSIGIFLGIVTPGQAGDAVKAWYLRKHGYSLRAGLASVVVDRLFDLGIMGVLAASGLYFFRDVLPGGIVLNVVVIAGVLGVVGLGLALAGSRRLRALIFGRVLPRILPESLRERLLGNSGLHLLPGQLIWIGVVSCFGLGLTFLRTYLLFIAVGSYPPFGPFVALTAIIAIVGTFSPGGIGTRDLALILGLAAILNQSTQDVRPLALTVSTLLLALSVLNVLCGFLLSLRYPVSEATAKQVTES